MTLAHPPALTTSAPRLALPGPALPRPTVLLRPAEDPKAAPLRACRDCDVQWRSTDAACWCCGKDADPVLNAVASKDQSRHTPPAEGEARRAQARLTRWGSDVHRLLSMGLPDPRAAHLRG